MTKTFWDIVGIIKPLYLDFDDLMTRRNPKNLFWRQFIVQILLEIQYINPAILAKNEHFSLKTFFSKNDFDPKKNLKIILMLQKSFFNLFNVSELSPIDFG